MGPLLDLVGSVGRYMRIVKTGNMLGFPIGKAAGQDFNATTGVPINGTPNWGKGALFINFLDGILYQNIGTNLSSTWIPSARGNATTRRFAGGVASITGTGTVATGLATVVAVTATSQTDLDGTTHAGVSATIGDQAGAPVAGSVILKSWKATSTSVTTLIPDTTACSVNYLAVGT